MKRLIKAALLSILAGAIVSFLKGNDYWIGWISASTYFLTAEYFNKK